MDKNIDEIKSLSKDYEVFEIHQNSVSSAYFDAEYVLPWNLENLKKRNQSSDLRASFLHYHLEVDFIIQMYTEIRNKNNLLVNRIKEYIDRNY